MRLWRVILLINLALALGLMLGYLAWGRDVLRLQQDLEQARRQQAVAGGARSWQSRGVEWLTTSPPSKHNFDKPIVVTQDPHSYQQPGEEVEHVVI